MNTDPVELAMLAAMLISDDSKTSQYPESFDLAAKLALERARQLIKLAGEPEDA